MLLVYEARLSKGGIWKTLAAILKAPRLEKAIPWVCFVQPSPCTASGLLASLSGRSSVPQVSSPKVRPNAAGTWRKNMLRMARASGRASSERRKALVA